MELLPPEVILVFFQTPLASFSPEYETSLLILLEVDNPLSAFAETYMGLKKIALASSHLCVLPLSSASFSPEYEI